MVSKQRKNNLYPDLGGGILLIPSKAIKVDKLDKANKLIQTTIMS